MANVTIFGSGMRLPENITSVPLGFGSFGGG